MEEMSPMLRASLFEAIENQVRDGTSPETKRTLDRLMGQGMTKDDLDRVVKWYDEFKPRT